jgi:hypothetical protein
VVAVIAAAAVFNLLVGYYQLSGLHEWHAVLEYDDGVWFGSAVRLAHGVLPYRSFVMDQPPGVPLLLAPFGLLSRLIGTRDAFGAARLVTPLVGTVTVIAAGALVRHRGMLAAAVASGVAAIFPEALIDQRTVMLEPFCALFCVLGLVGIFEGDTLSDRPRRVAAAGVAFGLAGSCKAFALLPFVVVMVAFLLVRGRRRRVVPLVAGAAAALVAVCGPFFALAPGPFVHQVIVTQIVRSQKSEPALWDRLFSLIGLLPGTGTDHGYPDDPHVVDGLVVAAFAVAVLGGWAVRARRSGAPALGLLAPLDLVAGGVVVVTAAALVQPPAYYGHYSAFFAPFLALALGVAAGSLDLRCRRVVAAVVVVALVVGSAHAVDVVRAQRAGPFEAARLDALIPPGACVVSDNAPVLLLADRFTSAVTGCPATVDAYGTTISAGQGDAPDSARADRNGAVATWHRLLARVGYIVLTSGYESERIPWTPRLRAYVTRNFRTLQSASPTVLVRRSPAPP